MTFYNREKIKTIKHLEIFLMNYNDFMYYHELDVAILYYTATNKYTWNVDYLANLFIIKRSRMCPGISEITMTVLFYS